MHSQLSDDSVSPALSFHKSVSCKSSFLKLLTFYETTSHLTLNNKANLNTKHSTEVSETKLQGILNGTSEKTSERVGNKFGHNSTYGA
jgi:hypothetical protein